MINTENYEEYFLDYFEGNLSDEKRREVLTFVTLHPELKAELEDFAGSPIVMPDEKELTATDKETMYHTSDYDDKEVPYFERLAVLNIENIATSDEQQKYQELITKNKENRKIAKQYTNCILQPENIEYPEKRKLLVVPMWKKIVTYAAAASVAALIFGFFGTPNNEITINPITISHVDINIFKNVKPTEITDTKAITEVSNIIKKSIKPQKNNLESTDKVTKISEVAQLTETKEVNENPIKTEIAIDTFSTTNLQLNEIKKLVAEDFEKQDEQHKLAEQTINKNSKTRKKFLFKCGKILRKVTRKIVPNIYFDIDHNTEGQIRRIAMHSNNKIYEWERNN